MEIVFVESASHIVSAFLVFVAGLVAITMVPFQRVSLGVSVSLYLWHTLFCVYYAWFALNETTDARGYYVRSLQSYPSFVPGTEAVDFITFIFTQMLGLSYLGAFLVYNIIGAVGLFAFLAALRETLQRRSHQISQFVLAVAFLPGVSFWSVAIGKDAFTFLGAGLLCWSGLNLRRRWPALLIGILATAIVRPHIAAVAFAALMLGSVFAGKIDVVKKFLILAVLAVPTYFSITMAMSFVGVGENGTFSDVGELLEYRQSVNMDGTSSIDISNMILPLQMLVYAFGPLFIGAAGIMGLVASFENAFLLFLMLYSTWYMFKGKSSLPPFAKWFFLVYAMIMWVVLATTTTNLGIALRQKWMFFPMLLLFALSYLPEKRKVQEYHPIAPARRYRSFPS